jgi:hypothetical protein
MKTFYVGKGTGNRIFQHLDCAVSDSITSDKLSLIREILRAGLEVEHYILRHGLSEEQALEIESACIDLLGLDSLTNQAKGHNFWERGLKTVDEITQQYDAIAITIAEPAIIININRLYKRFMTDHELYEATRSSWVIGAERRKTLKYAFASYRGLVREVYEIENWNKIENRWEFTGRIANSQIREKYINQSLVNYIQKGNRNPIRYTY